jgi:signal transduction histidine kinase/ligand-binding sensor domain-containing protein
MWVSSDEGIAVSEKPLSDYPLDEKVHFTTRCGSRELIKTRISQGHMCCDAAGRVWVGALQSAIIRYVFNGLDSLNVDTLRIEPGVDGKSEAVGRMIARKDGSVWAGLERGDLIAFHPQSDSPVRLTEKNGLPRVSPNVLYETAAGVLCGGSYDGSVWRLNESKGIPQTEVVSRELKSIITGICETPDSTLLIGSQGSGMLRIDERPQAGKSRLSWAASVHYTVRNGLLKDIINGIFRDREGNIWISQSGGISRLQARFAAFRNYTGATRGESNVLLPDPSTNVVIPPAGAQNPWGLWVGTTAAGIVLIKGDGETENIQNTDGLKTNWVNGLAMDAKSRLWICTTGGINCLALDEKYPPPTAPGQRTVQLGHRKALLGSYDNSTMYSSRVLTIPEGKSGSGRVECVCLTGGARLYCYAGEAWYLFGPPSGLPASFYDVAEVDDAGVLWVGTHDNGLYRSKIPITLEKLKELKAQAAAPGAGADNSGVAGQILTPLFEQVWSRSTGAPSNQIEALVWKNGNFWIGTPEGVVCLQGNSLKVLSVLGKAEGLDGTDATSMAFSNVWGTLWAGTNGGLAEIDINNRKVVRTVTKNNGLVDNEVWWYGSVAAGDDGTVYFGTAKGLSLYAPQFDRVDSLPPIIAFQKTAIHEDASGHNEADFEYAALSYANEKVVRYKTKLVGYDQEWSPEKTDVSIRYTNLGAFGVPRTYSFQVAACNGDGVWTDTPIGFSFDIKPPWWYQWWWIGAYVFILGGVVVGFNRERIRRLEKRSRELEVTVEERTYEIREKAEEIRRQSNELAATNIELEEKNREIVRTQEQLIMQEKLASLGALTAGIAHEIKNPLNFVNNFAELSAELIQELREDFKGQSGRLDPKILERMDDALTDLEHNATKINEHGKRADSIVRGMLLHSRGKSGERTPTHINTLLEEYVNLAYHGLRATDSTFNITLKKDYDESVGQLDVVPQDLSRVFLNIVNNACYAANERKKASKDPSFVPTLWVCTRNLPDKIEIRIRDNGTGIPKGVIDKIFEPFFTTKPTGKGTGLGLSLSYDIVVKQHQGELLVESKEGEYTEFIIRLPKKIS